MKTEQEQDTYMVVVEVYLEVAGVYVGAVVCLLRKIRKGRVWRAVELSCGKVLGDI